MPLLIAMLATRGNSQNVEQRDPESVETPFLVLETGGHTAVCMWLDFTPDGRSLVSVGNDKVIRIWDVQDPWHPTLRQSIRLHAGKGQEGLMYCGAISPDGRWLAVAGRGSPLLDDHIGDIQIVDLRKGSVTYLLRGHTHEVNSLDFSRDGRLLASASHDKTVRVWNLAGVAPGGEVQSLVLKAHSDIVYRLAWLPTAGGADRLVSVSNDRTGRIWQRGNDGRWFSSAVLSGHSDTVGEVACSPDGRWIVTSSLDRTVRLWDSSGRFQRIVSSGPHGRRLPSKIDFSADGRWLVAADAADNGGANVWTIPGCAKVSQFRGHDDTVREARFAPRAAAGSSPPTLVVASTGGLANDIHLWNPASGQAYSRVMGRGRAIHSVAFSKDGSKIAWGQSQAALASSTPLEQAFDLGGFVPVPQDLFRAEQYQTHHLVRNAHAPSHDGYTAGPDPRSPSTLIVRRHGREVTRIKRDTEFDLLRCHAFLPGRDMIVVGSIYALTLHDANTGELLRLFDGHTGEVLGLDVSPDGLTLVSSSSDQTIRMWDLDPKKLPTPKPMLGVGLQIRADKIVIQLVKPDGAGADAGLRVGDVLESIGNQVVNDIPTAISMIQQTPLGSSVSMDVQRNGNRIELSFRPKLGVAADSRPPLLSFFFTADRRDFVAWTPEGYFDCSPGGETLIGWQTNQGIGLTAGYTSAWQYARSLKRPDILERMLTVRDADQANRLSADLSNRRPQDMFDVRSDADRLAIPSIAIETPKSGDAILSSSVRLIGQAVPTGSLPIDSVRVLVNGRPVAGTKTIGSKSIAIASSGGTDPETSTSESKPKDARAVSIDMEIPLVEGPNTIEVVASTTAASSQPFTLDLNCTTGSARKPSLYVMGIGVSKYAHDDQPGLPEDEKISLTYPTADVNGMIEALRRQEGHFYDRVVVGKLLDEQVTERNIRAGFASLRKKVTQHDVAIILVSAHGTADDDGSYFLCPHDFDPEQDAVITGIRWSELTEPLSSLPCKVLLCMDTCHAGAVMGPVNNGRRSKGIQNAVRSAISDLTNIEAGVVVMTSSTGREVSFEDDRWGHGAFALALIEALTGERKGPPGQVTLPADFNSDQILDLAEIDTYVTSRVKELTDGKQHPVTDRGRIPAFPIAISH
ncbi:caspase family protein [Stieleria varia]|nr:caspase family protein [Stieleria varia]